MERGRGRERERAGERERENMEVDWEGERRLEASERGEVEWEERTCGK